MLTTLCGLDARSNTPELIDLPIDSNAELEESFRDIALVNRSFGGIAVARHALATIGAKTVLDVACGTGDIAATLRTESVTRGKPIAFTGLDSNARLVELARDRYASDPELQFVCGDAMALPFDDNAFDCVTCNLSFHHFAPSEAIALLREMRRVARLAPLVTDLRRSVTTWLAAFAFSRAFTRNRLTRHDAPLSARRAYTIAEARELALLAGWTSARVDPYGLIRMVVSDAATL